MSTAETTTSTFEDLTTNERDEAVAIAVAAVQRSYSRMGIPCDGGLAHRAAMEGANEVLAALRAKNKSQNDI